MAQQAVCAERGEEGEHHVDLGRLRLQHELDGHQQRGGREPGRPIAMETARKVCHQQHRAQGGKQRRQQEAGSHRTGPGDRERRQRPPTHGIDVAQRVRRRNLAVHVGVVDNRREEVHCLHQRRPALPRVHTGIVMSPEIDEDPWIGGRRKAAQDLSELARGEFARSTGAADHLGQPLLVRKHRHRNQ